SKTIGRRLADMVQYSGFFPEAFGGGDTLRKPPEGDLGPRYTVRYRMTDVHPYSTLVQDVYPFAAAGPVTSMDRGQSIWGERTKGGWFVGRPRLAGVLRDLGIRKPEPSPSAVPSSSAIQSHLPTGWIVIGVVLVLAAGAALLRARRAHLPA